MERIHRLNQGNIRQHQLELIGLEMADEMPLHIGRHFPDFCRKFLRAALGKDALAGLVGFHQAFYGVEFGNCHQLYT